MSQFRDCSNLEANSPREQKGQTEMGGGGKKKGKWNGETDMLSVTKTF